MNKNQTEFLQYWNVILTKESITYMRVKYKMVDLIGDVGGLLSILNLLAFLIALPFNYKKHEIKVYKHYKRLENKTQ